MNWQKALQLIRLLEGDWSDNPADPGGATRDGITLRAYREFRIDPTITPDALRQLADEDISAFYHWYMSGVKNLAGRLLVDIIPEPADAVFFQWAVNSGPSAAVRGLQAALLVTPDGLFGPVSQEKMTNLLPATLARRLLVAQLAHLAATHEPSWPFYRGIADRAAKVLEFLGLGARST